MSFYKAGSNSKLVVRITLLGEKGTGKKSKFLLYVWRLRLNSNAKFLFLLT